MKKLIWRATLLALAGVAIVLAFRRIKDLLPPPKMPPATQALMDRLGQADRDLLQILYLVRNRHLHAQATAVLNLDGALLTDASILAGSHLGDVEVRSSRGQAVPLKGMEINRALGIGLLFPATRLKDGIDLSQSGEAGPGDTLYTWGFPEDCEPPQPLLCMGFVAGYKTPQAEGGAAPARLILGGPFGEGYGGGPVYRWRDNQFVGLLVLRRAPASPTFEEDLTRLADGVSAAGAAPQAESPKGEPLTREQLEARLIREAARGRSVRAEVVPAAAIRSSLENRTEP